jgi:hypothetical protein
MEVKHTLNLSLEQWQSKICSCKSHESVRGEWICSFTTSPRHYIEIMVSFTPPTASPRGEKDPARVPQTVWTLWRRDTAHVPPGNRTTIHRTPSRWPSYFLNWTIPAAWSSSTSLCYHSDVIPIDLLLIYYLKVRTNFRTSAGRKVWANLR